MSSDSEEKEEAIAAPVQEKKKGKYRRDKPWDNDPTVDKWKMPDLNSKSFPFNAFYILFKSQFLLNKVHFRLFSQPIEHNIFSKYFQPFVNY